MNNAGPDTAVGPPRQCLIDDMSVPRFSRETRRNYVRDLGRFATVPRRSLRYRHAG